MLKFIVYISILNGEYSQVEFENMSKQFAQNNSQTGITGILTCKGKHIMQYIEGESEDMNILWKKIENDRRHHGVKILYKGRSYTRLFSEWSMQYMFNDYVSELADVLVNMKRVSSLFNRFCITNQNP
jgi:Sensors of blue-light using FAD